MSEPKRSTVIYVTEDSGQWIKVDVPHGMIAPPTLEVGIPLHGTVLFYWADCYKLRIPAEARS